MGGGALHASKLAGSVHNEALQSMSGKWGDLYPALEASEPWSTRDGCMRSQGTQDAKWVWMESWRGGGNEGAQACSQDLPPPRGPGPGIAAHKEPPRLSQALRDLEAHPR